MPKLRKPAADQQRVYEFAIQTSIPMPKGPAIHAGTGRGLPFISKYDEMLKIVAGGHAAMIFVPNSFWVSRGIAADKVDRTYANNKLKDHFRKWKQAKLEDATVQATELNVYELFGNEGYAGVNEPGVGVWMTKSALA